MNKLHPHRLGKPKTRMFNTSRHQFIRHRGRSRLSRSSSVLLVPYRTLTCTLILVRHISSKTFIIVLVDLVHAYTISSRVCFLLSAETQTKLKNHIIVNNIMLLRQSLAVSDSSLPFSCRCLLIRCMAPSPVPPEAPLGTTTSGWSMTDSCLTVG